MRGSGRLRASGMCMLALALSGCVRQHPFGGESGYKRAVILLQREQFREAASEANRGLASAPKGSRLSWDFRLLRAEILLAMRESQQAADALKVPPPDTAGFTPQMARYRLYQAYLAQLAHDVPTARMRLDQAQALAETVPDGRLRAQIEMRRALLDGAGHDLEAARTHLTHVLSYADARKDDVLRMAATGSMGYVLMHNGHTGEAVSWFKKTVDNAWALGASTSEARALGNLGFCFFELGDLDRALRNFRLAEQQFASIGNQYETQIWLGNVGNVEEVNRDFEAAAADYGKALAISRHLADDYWTALWLNDLAVVSTELERWSDAERYNNEAMALQVKAGDEASTSYSLLNAGAIAVGRGQARLAEQGFGAVLKKKPLDVREILSAHDGLAQAYALEDRDSLAEKEFEAAMSAVSRQQSELLDERDKLTWFASVIRFLQNYIEFLMRRGRSEQALEVAHSCRGRLLTARLGERATGRSLAAGDFRRIAAKTNSTLLLYFVGQQKSYAWAVESSRITNFELPGQADLQHLVNKYDRFIQELRDPLHEEGSGAAELYRLLVAPAHIKTTTVMVAPDGPLYSLNFATLLVEGAQPLRYWLQDARISIVPSFDLRWTEQPSDRKSLLLIGDPISADQELPALKFASTEMHSIQERIAGVQTLVYSRENACVRNYAQSHPDRFSWIHFVAHATANRDEPLQSAVILSPEPGGDYRLLARDVLQTKLHAELVTISGCRGAGARVFAGEGLVGFSWAFLKSGARNVIAGLWDVNDRSTAETMAVLYIRLAQGGLPDEALRSAQLSLMHSQGVFRKPYYWGPFEVFTAISQ